MKRSYGILTLVTPLGVGEALEGKIVSMLYLLVNLIELSYETLYTIVNDHSSDRMMLYRSRIGDDLHEISHICFGPWRATLAYEP